MIFRQKLFYLTGVFVVSLSILFIAATVWQHWTELSELKVSFRLIPLAGLATLGYALAQGLVAYVWYRVLQLFGEERAKPLPCFILYAHSQIAKYTPGNVMHLAGRHVLGHQQGFRHGVQASAALYEVLALVACSGLVALAALEHSTAIALRLPALVPLSALALVLVFPYALRWILRRMKRTKGAYSEFSMIAERSLRPSLIINLHYLGFFAIAGLSFWSLVYGLEPRAAAAEPAYLISVFSIAWAVGFLTPGAPAGFGVREAVLVALLAPVLAESQALVAALLFRLVTILGDILVFATPSLFPRRWREIRNLSTE